MLGLGQERYKTSLGHAVKQERKEVKNYRPGHKKQGKTVEVYQLGDD